MTNAILVDICKFLSVKFWDSPFDSLENSMIGSNFSIFIVISIELSRTTGTSLLEELGEIAGACSTYQI